MKISTRLLLSIDRWFRWPHRWMDEIFSSRTLKPGHSGQVLVIKLMGLGSIIRFAALCDEQGVDKRKITLLTFSHQRELGPLFGFEKNILIRTNHLVYFLIDCWNLFVGIRSLNPTLIIDFERCSDAVGFYSTVLAWRTRCKKVSFEKRTHDFFSSSVDIFAIHLLTHEGFFLKGITYLSKFAHKVQRETVEIDSKKVLLNINVSNYLLARRYPKNSFKEVIQLLHLGAPELEFHFTGSKSEFDYVQDLVTELSDVSIKAFNRSGMWDLTRLAKELADCVVFITGDSGPLHLAAYMQVPTLAVWGPTQAAHFGYDKRELIRHASLNLPCSPCFTDPTSKAAVFCKGQIHCIKLPPSTLANLVFSLISRAEPTRQVIVPSGLVINSPIPVVP